MYVYIYIHISFIYPLPLDLPTMSPTVTIFGWHRVPLKNKWMPRVCGPTVSLVSAPQIRAELPNQFDATCATSYRGRWFFAKQEGKHSKCEFKYWLFWAVSWPIRAPGVSES